jgi:UDP-N-acetylmuramoyl-tripeptide--D-alanyl-D-alanine ligase
MRLTLAQVQAATGAQFIPAAGENQTSVCISGWSIDSRTLAAGDLFFAIKGEQLDGHAFVDAALARGAAAAVVSERGAKGPLLLVKDTLGALQSLARWARRKWRGPIVAVTGSAGKTSTKDIVAALLGVRFTVGKNEGNFNNHIGLPLAILRLPDDAEVAVLEMGMNHAGEIRRLVSIAEPRHGVVTNVGYAHVENFASIEGVAAAKRELIEALPKEGVAILNADDERVAAFAANRAGRSLTYGFSPKAQIRALDADFAAGQVGFTVEGVRFKSALAGRHSVSNILAGIAVAGVFDIKPAQLVASVADLAPAKMRGERGVWRGATVLNDSYNSNPEAARNMLDVLRAEPAERRIAVLGEMRELGNMSEQLHRELGAYAARAGIDVVVGIHGAARFLVESALAAGTRDGAAFFFDGPETAGDFLKNFVKAGDAILFKGSRGSKVETALARMES